MSFDLYSDYLNVALDRYSADELVKVWYDSRFSKQGVILRTTIMKFLPTLGKVYGVSVDENMSFQEFVKKYDELMYKNECNKSPDKCLEYFAKQGNWRNVKIAIKKGADNWNWGMSGAAKGGHLDLVKFFIEKGAIPIEWIKQMFNL